MEISPILPVLSATIPFIVEMVKNSSQITSITPETKGRLMALSAVLASSAGVISGFSDGTIDGPTAQVFVESAWQAAVSFGLVQGVYNFLKFLGVLGK